MAPQKPRWNWKSKGAYELEHFDVPFAVKEYLQNQVGQLLKECDVYQWTDWDRRDLCNESRKEREACKKELIKNWPGIFTGPHGATLRKPAWLPVFVLSAVIDLESLVKSEHEDTLEICTVVWNATINDEVDTIMGLSFFNNHLDTRAHFRTFVVDGASTSRHSIAVGEKGKGFILATQYLLESVEEHCNDLQTKPLKTGVSFRVGNDVGTFSWKKSRKAYPDPPCLQVIQDDLSPVTARQLAESWGKLTVNVVSYDAYMLEAEERNDMQKPTRSDELKDDAYDLLAAEKAVRTMYKRRFTQNLSTKLDGLSRDAMCPEDEIPNVTEDEVCVTVLGLPALSPEVIFSAIYGVMPPPSEWKVTDAVTFFKAPEGKSLFYHRDQLVPHPPPLIKLSVNYHGPLDISSDRAGIRMYGSDAFQSYRRKVGGAANTAFGTEPELAKEIALDVLQDHDADRGATFGRMLSMWLSKPDRSAQANADAYRDAFLAAWRHTHPNHPQTTVFYPHLPDRDEERTLIRALGMEPISVSTLTNDILIYSEAYTAVFAHAIRLLLAAPPVQHHVPGYAQLRRGMQYIFGDLDDAQITMRDYRHSYPSVIWDTNSNTFAFSLPLKCSVHKGTACVCYVGPYLSEALKNRRKRDKSTRQPREAGEGVVLEAGEAVDVTPKVFQAFMHAFNMESAEFDSANKKQGISTFFPFNVPLCAKSYL
ncbi:hypothetical protein HDZ31DRAFT_37829 [Schizophyllum fasciatum]